VQAKLPSHFRPTKSESLGKTWNVSVEWLTLFLQVQEVRLSSFALKAKVFVPFSAFETNANALP
jgi:hypothetical protein